MRKMLIIFGVVLTLLSACTGPKTLSSETEKALCEALGADLIAPSRNDTPESARALDLTIKKHRDFCK